MTILIAHAIPEEQSYQTDIYVNVQYIQIDNGWILLAFDEKDPLWEKFKDNHGILMIGYDDKLDHIEISQ